MEAALWVAKTGLDAQQTRMTVIANNLANVNTTGFKRDRATFEDLLYQSVRQGGAQTSADTTAPTGLLLGTGTRVVATEKLQLFCRYDSSTGTEQQAGRCRRVGGGLSTALPDALVQKILEGRTVALETCRINVGQVVGDDRHARLLRIETCLCYPESCFHFLLS